MKCVNSLVMRMRRACRFRGRLRLESRSGRSVPQDADHFRRRFANPTTRAHNGGHATLIGTARSTGAEVPAAHPACCVAANLAAQVQDAGRAGVGCHLRHGPDGEVEAVVDDRTVRLGRRGGRNMEFGPLVLQRTRGRTEIRKDLGKDDKGHKGTEAGSASRHGGRLGRIHPQDRVSPRDSSLSRIYRTGCLHACTRRHGRGQTHDGLCLALRRRDGRDRAPAGALDHRTPRRCPQRRARQSRRPAGHTPALRPLCARCRSLPRAPGSGWLA